MATSAFVNNRVGLKADNDYSASDIELWKRYKAGDTNAKWQLLDKFRGVIISNARKQSNVRPYSVVEAELKALTLKAFDTYNPNAGAKLSTHVINTYKKVSRDNISNQHAIRVPENIHFKYKPVVEASAILQDSLNREPTALEIANYTGMSLEQVNEANRRLRREMVESRLTYDPGIESIDPTAQAMHYAYQSLDPQGQYILQHCTGFNGAKELPDSKIRTNLKLTPYAYNKKKNEVVGVMQEALNTANTEF